MSRRVSAPASNSPARTTAVVVPSPTSLSWVFDISTIILAAGFWTSISFMIVAPSFVITISPMPATSILSIPRGPMVDRTISATILAAIMLLLWASLPLDREVPSLRIKTGVSDISNQILSRADGASQDKHMQADSSESQRTCPRA